MNSNQQFIKSKAIGLSYALLCVLLWAFIPVVSRFGQLELDNFQFLFWSNILSLIVVSIPTIQLKKFALLKSISTLKLIKLILLGTLGCAFYYLCLYYGYARGEGLEILIIQYSWPLLIVILSAILLKEKLSFLSVFAASIGFLGIINVFTKGNILNISFSNLSTNLIVLIGAFSFALFSVLSKKIQEDEYLTTSIYFLGGTILSTLSMFLFSNFSFPSQKEIIPVLFNGAFINGISYIFWLKALHLIPASFAAILVFFTPVIASLLIIIFFNEPFLWSNLIGLIMVLIAGFLASKNKG